MKKIYIALITLSLFSTYCQAQDIRQYVKGEIVKRAKEIDLEEDNKRIDRCLKKEDDEKRKSCLAKVRFLMNSRKY